MNKPKIKVIAEDKFDMLTVVQEADRRLLPCGKLERMFLCQCDCGIFRTVALKLLRNKFFKSCGCVTKHHSTHGLARGNKHYLYKVWRNVKSRCYNKNVPEYKYYGARGIVMCDAWLNDAKSFYDWAMSHGFKEGLELDRERNNGNYTPDNCRFVTRTVNTRNSRNAKLNESRSWAIKILYRKGIFSRTKLASIYGVCKSSISNVINNNTWQQQSIAV